MYLGRPREIINESVNLRAIMLFVYLILTLLLCSIPFGFLFETNVGGPVLRQTLSICISVL